MKKILFLIPLFGFYSAFCQKVTFKADSIFVNEKPCLLYSKTGNDFIIYKLDSTKLITGSVRNLEPGKFATKYTFLTVNKEISNSKINGRNALIFALIQNNVITESCDLDEKKLLNFIEKSADQ